MRLLCSWPPGTSVTEEHDLDFFGAEAKRRLGNDRRDRNSAPTSTSSTPQQVSCTNDRMHWRQQNTWHTLSAAAAARWWAKLQ